MVLDMSHKANINYFRRLAKFGYISFSIMFLVSEIGLLIWHFIKDGFSVPNYGGDIRVTDFVGFYIAGKIAASAQRTDLFNIDTFNHYYKTITGCTTDCLDIRIFHLPFLHLFMIPFASLPIDVAHAVFDIVSTAFGLLALCLLIKQTEKFKKSSALIFLLGILISYPSWDNWLQGQILWLYLGLAAIYCASFLSNNEIRAGIALALLSVKPQYALYLAIPPLICQRYRLLLVAAFSEFILFLICLIAFGPHVLTTYVQEFNHHELSSGYTHPELMNSIRALLTFIFSPENAYHISCMLGMIAFILVTGLSLLAFKKNSRTIAWIFSLVVVSSLLFSPHAHPHDCLLIAIPAILTLPDLANINKLSPSLFIWKWSLYLFPLTSWVRAANFICAAPGSLMLTAIIGILWLCALRQVLIAIKQNDKYQTYQISETI